MSGGYKNVPTKQTPVGSLLELCNSVKGSLENVSFKTSRTKEDFEGILKENEQLRGYLESLISRILEYPEALDVLSVSPLT
ncbi:hypothetical protein HMI56_003868 [Coelomomyces lativittatus]|nr:hypothetical protein HMI56_003868 [Coelomomyces lativittatus]